MTSERVEEVNVMKGKGGKAMEVGERLGKGYLQVVVVGV